MPRITFTDGEVVVLDFIVKTLLRGGDPKMATRHKDFASIAQKVSAMKAVTAEAKASP